MASGRRYRKQQKLIGKNVGVAHKSDTIDLTAADDVVDDDASSCETPIEPTAEIQAKSEPGEPKKESPTKPRWRQREMAKAFADRMQKRRNAKKTRRQAEQKNTSKRKESESSTVASAVPKKRSRRKTVQKKKVPFKLDTLVTREFDGEMYTVKITKLYPDDPSLCQVTYTDGDQEDFDVDEATYASALHARDCDDKS